MLDWLAQPHGGGPMKTANFGTTAPNYPTYATCSPVLDTDQSSFEDAPETPAHLFAVRAFKTALFGTPAPPPTTRAAREPATFGASSKPNEIEEPGKKQEIEKEKSEVTVDTEEKRIENARRRDPFASPSKGILLTPGTATTRRKNVSFGGFTKGPSSDLIEKGDCLEEHGMPQDALAADATTSADDLVRRNIFQSKLKLPVQSQVATKQDSIPRSQRISEPAVSSTKVRQETSSRETELGSENTADITIDLKSPRSRSGQHWKREYQRDHDRSKLEMRKLIRYGQAAKSYAIKRDQEAIRLRDKLNDTESQAKGMEDKVAELASQLANTRLHGDNQARILDDLATQTAQALRYKQKAERYRLALRSTEPVSSPEDIPTLPREFQDDIAASTELQNLKQVAAKAQRKATELEKKNASLKNNLSKAKDDLKAFEERHQKWIERRKVREEKLVAEKKELKDQLMRSEERCSKLQEQVGISGSEGHRRRSPTRLPDSERAQNRKQQEFALTTLDPAKGQGRNFRPRSNLEMEDRLRRQPELSIESDQKSSSAGSRLKERNATAMNQANPESPVELPRGIPQLRESSEKWFQTDDFSPVSPFVPASSPHKDILAPISYNTTLDNPRLNRQRNAPINQVPSKVSVHDSMLSSSTSSKTSTRRPMPADRLAAAKRRIEQRLAEKKRLGTPGKENLRS